MLITYESICLHTQVSPKSFVNNSKNQLREFFVSLSTTGPQQMQLVAFDHPGLFHSR